LTLSTSTSFPLGLRWVEIFFSSQSRSTTLDGGQTSHLFTMVHSTFILLFPATHRCQFPRLQEHTTQRGMFLLAVSPHRLVRATSLQHSCPQFHLLQVQSHWIVSMPIMAHHLTRRGVLPSLS